MCAAPMCAEHMHADHIRAKHIGAAHTCDAQPMWTRKESGISR